MNYYADLSRFFLQKGSKQENVTVESKKPENSVLEMTHFYYSSKSLKKSFAFPFLLDGS